MRPARGSAYCRGDDCTRYIGTGLTIRMAIVKRDPSWRLFIFCVIGAKARKFQHVWSAGLLHDTRSMDLHRPITDAQALRDLLVGIARDSKLHHFTFPFRQQCHAPGNKLGDFGPFAQSGQLLHGLLHASQQDRALYRLGQKVDRACLDGANRQRYGSLPGKKDNSVR